MTPPSLQRAASTHGGVPIPDPRPFTKSATNGGSHPTVRGGGAPDKGDSGPLRMPSRRASRDDVEDVVSILQRDISYSAVAAHHQHHRESSCSDEDYLASSSSRSSEVGSHVSRATSNTATEAATAGGSDGIEKGWQSQSNQQQQEDAEAEGIALRQRFVFLMIGVVAVLVIVAIAAIGVGISEDRESDQDKTEEKSEDLRNALYHASEEHQNNLHLSLRSFADVMTQQASSDYNNSTDWPLVCSHTYEIQGHATRTMFPAVELLAFSPLVATVQQAEWEDYAWENQNWIRESWTYLGNGTLWTGNIAPTVYEKRQYEDLASHPDYVAPLWQTSPPPTEAYTINQDMLSVPFILELFESSMTGNSTASSFQISPLLDDLPSIYGYTHNNDTATAYSAAVGPRSLLLLPIEDTLTSETASTVGLLQVVMNWQTYLEELLRTTRQQQQPCQSAVVRSQCGEGKDSSAFYKYDKDTGRLNYIGWPPEDSNEMGEDAIILENVLGGSKSLCSYSVEMQLESALDDDSDNNVDGILVLAMVPLVISLAVLGLIIVGLLQWIRMAEKRHHKLRHSAAKSSAIVASMFPSTIRDRLYADASGSLEDLGNSSSKNSTSKGTSKKSSKQRRGSLDMETASVETPHASQTAASSDKNAGTPETVVEEDLECYPEGRRTAAAGSERLKNYLDNGLTPDEANYSAPIADLFPNCTVLLADIAGFTAWSSVREPSQVFTLLETLYKAFDDIAKKRHVFKVETVGDTYVAVTGLPGAQEDHALIMVRFARDCMYKSYELTKKLEVSLGPDTAELSMRFGLHSGPVTAGVLRGDRSRFQLFGDTVNTASRMESTGQKGRIQMSQETADILVFMGKSHLVRQREDKVTAKGKGEMITYWVALGADPDELSDELPPPSLARNTSGVGSIMEGNEDESESTDDEDDTQEEKDDEVDNKTILSIRTMSSSRCGLPPSRRKPPAVSMSGIHSFKTAREKKLSQENRLVDWNVEILSKLLKHVIVRRNALGLQSAEKEVKLDRPDDQTILEEVREIITLPKFDPSAAKKQEDPEKMELDEYVKEQLHDYVATLASMYRENPFHNYQHASHVTMSVVKLLSRIVAPARVEISKMTSEEKIASELHDHTYGITSDPLTQFAIVLSALIHDVDHTGVPNSQLVKENARVAAYYKNKSVAEQNSVDKSWDLLMEPQFRELRAAIYCNEAELTRFRSLLVNAVMATDIVDKELKQLRNNRWDKAFSGEVPETEEEVHAAVNRKATIVLEHLIQASDVSHTMQHWHVYRKWNERLFHEMYNAYRSGRAEKDPSEFWYKGEIGFFDFYIIPLAKKLKDCGVFGVSSDEYLNYAMKNREEWSRKGEAVTAEMVAKARDKDLALMERQASVRGPVIAEMKAAVASMRSPQSNTDMFRQPSFRHLRTEGHVAESIAMPPHGFRRHPPRRGTPNNRGMSRNAVSIGTAERDALKQFRQAHPPTLPPVTSSFGSSRRSLPASFSSRSRSSLSTATPSSTSLKSSLTEEPESSNKKEPFTDDEPEPSNKFDSNKDDMSRSDSHANGAMGIRRRDSHANGAMGIRKPERRGSCF